MIEVLVKKAVLLSSRSEQTSGFNQTIASTAGGALCVLFEPLLQMHRMPTMAANNAEIRGSSHRQVANNANQRHTLTHITITAPGRNAAHLAISQELHSLVRLAWRGQML